MMFINEAEGWLWGKRTVPTQTENKWQMLLHSMVQAAEVFKSMTIKKTTLEAQ